jgi:hypothetical protein
VLKQLIFAGVRVLTYMDGRERTLNSPIEKALGDAAIALPAADSAAP